MSEISDQEILDSKKNFPHELVTEAINLEPQIKYFPRSQKTVIEIGNTGYRVEYIFSQGDKPLFRFDFMPEGRYEHSEKTKARNAVILGTALLELRHFTSNLDNLEENNIDKSGVSTLETLTNPNLAGSLVKLFTSHGHPELVSTDLRSYGTNIMIDWKGFEQLDQKDDLIVYLNKLKERAQQIKLTYKKEIV